MRQSLNGKDGAAPIHKTDTGAEITARRERRRCLPRLADVIALRFDDERDALRQPVFDVGAEFEFFVRTDRQQFSRSVEGPRRIGKAGCRDDFAFAGRFQKGACGRRRGKRCKPKGKQK